ncbi:hypothetical protein SMICM304S_04037 [Streptomyces microflavus]
MARSARRRTPARSRLRLLQLRLTVAYTLITVVGLSCLSWLVIRTDDRSRQTAEYDEMRRRASVAASLVYYEDDRIRLDGLSDDEATAGTPQILVLEDRPGSGPAVVFRGRTQQFDVPGATVARAARSAMRMEETVRQEARDRSGGPVRLPRRTTPRSPSCWPPGAHAAGLAIGQKNTTDLLGQRKSIGFDFAVAEECGRYDECADYATAYGNRVFVIEYTARDFSKACSSVGAKLSVVQRDLDVRPAGRSGYVFRTC